MLFSDLKNSKWRLPPLPRVVSLKEDYADDVVAHVAFALQLLRVVLLVGEEGGHVEHDFDAAPVRVHRVQAGQVVYSVQPALATTTTKNVYSMVEYSTVYSVNCQARPDNNNK